MKHHLSRRHFVKEAAAGLGIFSLPALAAGQIPNMPGKDHILKILCFGGHPDDPESGCGGTLAKLAAQGHTVQILYLTRGEAGIPGKSHEEAASIRTHEAEEACKILKAQPFFAGQIDGDTRLDNDSLNKILQWMETAKPDIVFAHWPLDTHKDHQIASILATQCWSRTPRKFDLYFFEVCNGEQTQGFRPTDHVDISDVQELKRKAVYCHQSQDPPGIYACGHTAMEEFRGRELGVRAAEAFVRLTGRGQGGIFSS